MLGDPTVAGEPLAVPRRSSPIALDGVLDEPAWRTAAVAGPFVSPGDGSSPDHHPVAAFAQLTWDDDGLWIGVVVDDRAPSSPFARDDNDPHVWERSSAVELMIQPGDRGDNRDYYEIQVDVAGAVFDTRWDDYNRPITGSDPATRAYGHMQWSSHVERAVHNEAKFYSIELAIPWSAFASARGAAPRAPPKPGDVWRMNLYSFRDGQRLALAWSPIRGEGNFHRSSRFGRVRFVD